MMVDMEDAQARWVPELIEQPDVPEGYNGTLSVRLENLDPSTYAGDAKLYMRLGLSADERELLWGWAVERLTRLAEHRDPGIDGWGEFEDGGALVLQLHARQFDHPEL